MERVVYDAKDAVVGRMGTVVAKQLLKGKEVYVINVEDALVSGNEDNFVNKFKRLTKMGHGGSMKGPKVHRVPHKMVKRIIRGMLPWDKPRGREVYRRLKCFNKTEGLKEEEYSNAKKFNHNQPFKAITIKKVVEALK